MYLPFVFMWRQMRTPQGSVMKPWWEAALSLCFIGALVLLMPVVVFASNCSSLDDCWGMARGAAAAAAGAGVAAAAAGDGDSQNGGGDSGNDGGAEASS